MKTATFTPEDIRSVPREAPQGQGSRRTENATRLRRLAEAMGNDRRPPHSPVVLAGLARFGEWVLLAGLGLLIDVLYVAPRDGYHPSYFAFVPLVAAFAVAVFQGSRCYSVVAFRSPIRQGMKVAALWTLVMLCVLAVVFFLRVETSISRVWLLAWYSSGLAALVTGRLVLAWTVDALTRSGRLERRTVIVGGGAPAEALLRELGRDPSHGVQVIGVFDDRDEVRSPDLVANFPKLGTVDDLVEFARHTRLDLVIFTLPVTAEGRLLEMLRKLWVLPIDIRLAAHANKLRFRPRSYSYIGAVPVLDVFDKPIADWDVIAKTLFDKVIGCLALIALAPVMALVAVAIKLDSRGPVLFKQKRYGFNNELIEVYKFRSMYVDRLDAGASKLVTRGDPRVTRVGRIIRKTSLDELPQLFNVVFSGNLSLVGPRPHALHAKAADRQYDDVVDGYFARHRVRPGLTGWAQVNGWRGETDTREKIQRRVEHDLAYIENWSLFFDLYILLITPLALVKAENAY